ncbi:MAG: CHASE3 domain-containing protein, partial [Pseudomonadota bacterium]
MFRKLSVKQKILICGCVPLLLAVAIGFVALQSINQMQATQKWVDHTQNVLRRASSIVTEAVNMETGMRGYLLAGRAEFLEPLEAGSVQFEALVDGLAITVSDNPPQVERLGEAKQVIAQWRQEIVEPRIELRREIGDAETMNDMARLVAEGRGKAYFDAFRAQIAEFIANEVALLDARSQELDRMLALGASDPARFREGLDWVSHTYRVIGAAQGILLSAVDIETGMRGYLLAGQEEFLEPLNAGAAAFEV